MVLHFRPAVVSKKMFHLQGQKGQGVLCVARIEGKTEPREPSSLQKRQETAQTEDAACSTSSTLSL